jgi:hypothetical protein
LPVAALAALAAARRDEHRDETDAAQRLQTDSIE